MSDLYDVGVFRGSKLVSTRILRMDHEAALNDAAVFNIRAQQVGKRERAEPIPCENPRDFDLVFFVDGKQVTIPCRDMSPNCALSFVSEYCRKGGEAEIRPVAIDESKSS